MTNYETPTIAEVGKAEELILGEPIKGAQVFIDPYTGQQNVTRFDAL